MIIYLATIVATILLQLFRAALDTTDGQPRRISMVQRGIDCACIVVLAAAPGFRAWHVGVAFAEVCVDLGDLLGVGGEDEGFFLAVLGCAGLVGVQLVVAQLVEGLGEGGGVVVLALDVHGLFEQGLGGGGIAVGGVPCAEVEQALGVLGAGFAVGVLGVVVGVLQLLGELLVLVVLDLGVVALLLGLELAWGHGGG